MLHSICQPSHLGNEIVISEIGITCSIGKGLPVVMNALRQNICGLNFIDIHGYPSAVGYVKDEITIDENLKSRSDRITHLAMDALSQTSGLKAYDGQRIGVFWGVGMAGAHWLELNYKKYFNEYAGKHVSPLTVPVVMPNATAAAIAVKYGIRGANWTIANACASSAMAIGQAMRALRDGYLDAAIAGGSDSVLSLSMLHAWARMRVLSRIKSNDGINTCRPFDAARNGICLAEGAACLLLEKRKNLYMSGTKPLAQLTGFGHSCDAVDLTEPSIQGQALSMEMALDDANLGVESISYLNAHATGTRKGDCVELMAIKQVFGQSIAEIPISSVKSAIGHTLGASGAIEAAICIAILNQSWIPPTQALSNPDSAFNGFWLPKGNGVAVKRPSHVMSNSFGFGGTNATLIFSHS